MNDDAKRLRDAQFLAGMGAGAELVLTPSRPTQHRELTMATTETEETITIQLPKKVSVLVHRNAEGEGWVTTIVNDTADTATGKPGIFGSTWDWNDRPSRADVARHVIASVSHEIEEVLGLDPHEAAPFDADAAARAVPAEHAAAVRDALTAAIDAPRLAAREKAEAVASDEDVTLLRAAHEWGVRIRFGRSKVTDGQIEWFAGPDAEREARAIYADQRGKAICVCGVECDEGEIDRSDDEPQCPACVAAAVEHWRTADVVCMAGIFVPDAHAFAPGGCGWSGKGAEARVVDGEPTCPRCEGGVEEVIGQALAPPPPRYVVGTVDAAPDGTLVAVLLGEGVGIVDACHEFNRDQSAAGDVTWHRPADGFCSDLPLDTPCIIDTAPPTGEEG